MAELYESVPTRTLQAWRALLQWVTFVFQIVLQILRGTQIASSLLAFRNQTRLLFPSGEGSGSDSPLEFTPVPVEIPVDAGDESVERLTVVLDLDETLVCAYETSSLTSIIQSQAIEAGLRCFELECVSTEREADGKQKVNRVTVFERPGLHEFLQETSEFADLVLFTAGLEGYARPLVDKIDAGNKFCLRLYRTSTTTTEYRDHVKDLSCLSKSLCRMVIVDNNPFSFLLQPLNGIPCVPFYAGQPYDEQLMKVILPLLKHLSVQKDVRPVLHEKFHMPEWFQKHGIPMCD